MADAQGAEELAQEGNTDAPGPGSSGEEGSDVATGVEGGEQEVDNLSDDILSDTGWDTDLEIETEEKEGYDPTGRKTYIQTCNTLGIIPASCFLRTIQNTESHINMAHHGVGPKGAKAIAITLMANTEITHLDLSDNGLSTEGVVAITGMMKENCYITYLDLSSNDAGPPAAYAVAQMMSSNSTLTHLLLSANGFDDQAAEPLADVIRTSLHLKYLDLSHNNFGERAGELLGPAIGDSENLQTLNLNWNHLRRKGAEAIAEGLKTNSAVRTLRLAYNGFADKGMVALADALKPRQPHFTACIVLHATPSNNRIMLEGAIAIAKVFPTHENLKMLRLAKNPIQPAGLSALVEAVGSCSTPNFECLDLDGNTITLDIEKRVDELKDSHPQIAIYHGGVGGLKPPKPLLPPMAKLLKYCKENKVELMDLFRLFDKEQRMVLSEEEFRNALKHISSPLMEFERIKLINEYKVSPAESDQPEATAEDEDKPVFIDYMVLVGVARDLDSTQTQPSNDKAVC